MLATQIPPRIDDYGRKVVSYNRPEVILAFKVLQDAVRSIINCPKTIKREKDADRYGARARLIRAIEALSDAHIQPSRYILWCEVADINPDWLSSRIKTLAQAQKLLITTWKAWKEWEEQNA